MKFLHAILFAGLISLSGNLAAQEDTLILIGVGDIMMGTDYPSRLYLPPGDDCRPLMQDVYSILREADITFGNLEGTFAGDSGQAKECLDTTKCFVFRMPVHYVNCLVDAGFDLLSIANNHSNDFGTGGRRETERVLEANGLAYAGSLATPFTVVERDSIRYGLIAFAPNRGCYSTIDLQQGAAMVRQLRDDCDVLIVSVHGGAEGADHQHVTREPEVYLGQDRGNIYEFAHAVIDAGADVVFGHGPHVTRAAEVYRDRFIIYSLGNFCTYRRFNLRGPNGIAPVVKLFLSPDGRFLRGEIIPVFQPGEGGVRLDPQKGAIHKLKELTEEDFPEVPLAISEDGSMNLNPEAVHPSGAGQVEDSTGLRMSMPDSAEQSIPAGDSIKQQRSLFDSAEPLRMAADSVMKPDSAGGMVWPPDSLPEYPVPKDPPQ